MKITIKTILLKLGFIPKKKINKIFSEAITRLKNKDSSCMCIALAFLLKDYLGYFVTCKDTENLLYKYGYTRKNFHNYVRAYMPKYSHLLNNELLWISDGIITRISFLQYLIDGNTKRITRKKAHKRKSNIYYIYRRNNAKTWINNYSSEQIKWLLDHKHLKLAKPIIELGENSKTLYLAFTKKGNFWYDWYSMTFIEFLLYNKYSQRFF